jgi:hypothetical protein
MHQNVKTSDASLGISLDLNVALSRAGDDSFIWMIVFEISSFYCHLQLLFIVYFHSGISKLHWAFFIIHYLSLCWWYLRVIHKLWEIQCDCTFSISIDCICVIDLIEKKKSDSDDDQTFDGMFLCFFVSRIYTTVVHPIQGITSISESIEVFLCLLKIILSLLNSFWPDLQLPETYCLRPEKSWKSWLLVEGAIPHRWSNITQTWKIQNVSMWFSSNISFEYDLNKAAGFIRPGFIG